MLLSLHIENIAIIEKSDIDFYSGFNVLTGETGAGKSIIIDSINFLLGNKSAKNLIRTGSQYAFVSAVFCDFSNEQKQILEENGVFVDEDGNIIVSRRITSEGRSYSKINDVAVTVTTLKNIANVLVNIHGQHDGAKILDSSSHLGYLDAYCDNYTLIDQYQAKYNHVKAIRNELLNLNDIKNNKLELEEALKFKIGELEKADIKIGELEKLKSASLIAENVNAILKSLHMCESILSGEDIGVIDSIEKICSEIESVAKLFDESNAVLEALTRVKAELSDVSILVNKKLSEYDDFDYSPDFVEKRIFDLEKIVNKYGGEQSAIDALEGFKKELSKLSDNDFEIEQKTEEYKIALSELEEIARKLSEKRKKYADILSSEITTQLKELDMPNIRFAVSIVRNKNSKGGNKYTAFGYDLVEFFISPNMGQDLKPLSKVASGGELSRIMLCLKTILNSAKGECSTIIYDEIDSGVSGSTAQKIGIKIKKSAENSQVFSITHLAQIAALADNHFKVEKITQGNMTTSHIKLLNDEQRVYEVARIMGGVDITQQILKSAQEMINNSKMC